MVSFNTPPMSGDSMTAVFYNSLTYQLLDSKEYQALSRTAGKLNPTSAGSFIKAVLSGIVVRFVEPKESGLSQVFVDVKHRNIIDGIINGVDNLTISRCRKRLFSGDLNLEFLHQILEMKTNIRASYLVDLAKGKIQQEKWDTGHWKKEPASFIKGLVQMVMKSVLETQKGAKSDEKEN